MRQNVFAVSLLILIAFGTKSYAFEVVISTSNPSGNQGSPLGFSASTAVAFQIEDLSTATQVVEVPANLDVFHVRENGNYLLSTNTGVTFGGLTFEDGHVVEYDPVTDIATSFVDFEAILDPAVDIDIDAVSELPDGRVAFSTLGDGAINVGPNAGLAFTQTDVIVFNPTTLVADVLFDGSQITDGDRFNNISAVSVLVDGRIALAVSTGGTPDITLGGIQFARNDVVLYDPQTGTASVLMEGSNVFEGPPNPNVDAAHVIPAVPEPSATILTICVAFLSGCWRRCRSA